MIETITEEQLTPQQAEFWVRARQAVDMNNYPYAVSLLKALVKQLPGFLEGRKALRACEIKLKSAPASLLLPKRTRLPSFPLWKTNWKMILTAFR